MLITLLGAVIESVNCQVLLLLKPHKVPSFQPSLRPRLYWALVISHGLHFLPTSLCRAIQTKCGCRNDFGICHRHNEYRFPLLRKLSVPMKTYVSQSGRKQRTVPLTYIEKFFLIFLRFQKTLPNHTK